MTNRPTRRSTRVPACTVATTDGARAFLPELDLVHASAVAFGAAPCRCVGCFKTIAPRAEYVIASRTSDTTGDFDITWCTLSCRARFLGGSK